MEVICCRWLMHRVASSNLTRFPWDHLVSYILPFSSESSLTFFLTSSKSRVTSGPQLLFLLSVERGWAKVVSGFLSALKFCLCKLCPSVVKRMSVGNVRVAQLFLIDRV